jgi:CRP/FNR family cyclic AMP-dependent transcriptional regulator
MACDPEILKRVPLFALLDDDETAVLAGQVEVRTFAERQRIYKIGDAPEHAYVMVSGSVRVTMIDEDHQDVVVSEPAYGEFFGFASMLEQTPHQTDAIALEATVCIEVDRNDIMELIQRKPHAGMDMLSVLGRQLHATQQLVRARAARHPNEMIEGEATLGERIADAVAGFGGSWTFIITFLALLVLYTAVNLLFRTVTWDPYPFILLNLFLSMLAALQAPVIMMSQNRQDTKDRLRGELDYEVNRRAETEIQGVSRKLNHLGNKVADVEDLLREVLWGLGVRGERLAARRDDDAPGWRDATTENLG